MTMYAQHVSTKQTQQSQPVPGKPMVENSAGGYGFQLDDFARLDRFLILGNDGGTYYAGERALTIQNADCVKRCLAQDPARAIARIVEISEAGRAPKNDPAIFALSLGAAFADPDPNKQALVRTLALSMLTRVCRTGTHLTQFWRSVTALRGKGRSLHRAVAGWFQSKDPDDVAYQMLKYQQRDGVALRDLLRLARPKSSAVRAVVGARVKKSTGKEVPIYADGPATDPRDLVYRWALRGWESVGEEPHPVPALQRVWAFERLKRQPDPKLAVKYIRDYRLPREALPTELLGHAEVWEALLDAGMPLTALIRNLATMTRVGLVTPLSAGLAKVTAALADAERLRKSRVHPVAVLSALLTYKQGHGERGKHTWTPVSQVVDALDAAFYAAFANVEPTNKRWFLGIDVSGSMWGSSVAGVPGLSAGVGAAAMAMVTAATEPSYYAAAFNTQMVDAPISPRQRLDDVANMLRRLPWGGTDCSQPMLHALERRLPVDVFVVYTDNETWAGAVHPFQALQLYRQKTGIPAKLVVVGMTATQFTIADPSDPGMLDVVGFDTNVPGLMAQFVLG